MKLSSLDVRRKVNRRNGASLLEEYQEAIGQCALLAIMMLSVNKIFETAYFETDLTVLHVTDRKNAEHRSKKRGA
ncbi:hypothetical protein HR09_06190 [Porphyromonas gulae]|nr:hypothetical protein HR09_06190 [Porphyromonas gulae]